jgi:hypothetical protein
MFMTWKEEKHTLVCQPYPASPSGYSVTTPPAVSGIRRQNLSLPSTRKIGWGFGRDCDADFRAAIMSRYVSCSPGGGTGLIPESGSISLYFTPDGSITSLSGAHEINLALLDDAG